MSDRAIITLTSDFGMSDVYVGVMKGVIAQVNPTLTVIDITHDISPQNIAAARFCLMSAYSYFPNGTVHIAVVDPGVGSKRRGVAIEFAGGFLVGPDNGIFSGILSQNPPIAAVELTNPKYWRTPTPSTTFHGRDIFAPVGANLANGVHFLELGELIDSETLVQLPLTEPTEIDDGVLGYIQYVDRFGNLITNIPSDIVEGKIWLAEVAGFTISGKATYSDSHAGSLVALIGSHGWIEIAVTNGNAQAELQMNFGDMVKLCWH